MTSTSLCKPHYQVDHHYGFQEYVKFQPTRGFMSNTHANAYIALAHEVHIVLEEVLGSQDAVASLDERATQNPIFR